MLRRIRRVPAGGRRAGGRRREPRRDGRAGAQAVGRRAARRAPAGPLPPSRASGARTGRASPGASSGATTPSSRSTPTSRTTPPPCRRWWRRSRRASTSPSARATSTAAPSPTGPGIAICSRAAATSTPRAVLGLGVADSTAGYRAYSAGILRRLDLDRIRAEGYGFQIEMTYRAKQHGAAITEVPISFVDREAGESKMSSIIVVEALGARDLVGPGPAAPGRCAGASVARRRRPTRSAGRGAGARRPWALPRRRRPDHLRGAEDPVRVP